MNSGEEESEAATAFNDKLRSSIGVFASGSQVVGSSRMMAPASTSAWIEN